MRPRLLPLLLAGLALSGCPEKDAPAVMLAFEGDVPDGTRGAPLGEVRVVAIDAKGRRTSAHHGPVLLSLWDGSDGAILGGAGSPEGGHGAFIYRGLTIDRPGAGYRLRTHGAG